MRDGNIPLWQKLQKGGMATTPTGAAADLAAAMDDYRKLMSVKGNPGKIGTTDNIEKSWVPGAYEAAAVYNQTNPNKGMGRYKRQMNQIMQTLQGMQDPSQNPYLMDMLSTGQQSIADQTMSSLGLSGRGPGMIDPVTGQVSDSALNLINNVGDFTTDFLGSQYQNDMNRALQASTIGGDMAGNYLGTVQNQPWNALQNYANIVAPLTGSSPQQPERYKTSGWDKLMGIGSMALGAKIGGVIG